MKTMQKSYKILSLSAFLIILSMIFMILVLPAIYLETIPDEKNTGAAIGVSLAALFRFLLFFSTILMIKRMKTDGGKRKNKDYLLLIAILLSILGFIYMDGAFSFQHPDFPSYISNLMFVSVGCDYLAAILIFLVVFGLWKKK